MSGDILLRDPGASPGDISLGETLTASFNVSFTFSAGLTLLGNVEIASVEPEIVATLADDARVVSIEPEIIAGLGSDPRVVSIEPEIMVGLSLDARLVSIEPEIIAARPLNPYSTVEEGGTSGSAGICVSFASPTRGYGSDEACCSGFDGPECGTGTGGTPGVETLLAFAKATDDEVLLCSRGAFTGYYPVTGVSMLTWARVTEYNGGAAGEVPIISAMSSTIGWRVAYAGTADPDTVRVQYRDTGATVRSDDHAFSSGDLRGAGWRAVGGFRGDATPWTQRAFVDDEVGGTTNGTVAPQSGQNSQITLFGEQGGTYFTGLMFSPLFLAVAGGVAQQTDYFADLGARTGDIFDAPTLLISPRPKSTVLPGDAVAVWVVDVDNNAVPGPTVWGTPAYWRGPWWGLEFTDIHWIQVPWVNSSVTTGKTLLLCVQGASIPASDQYVVGRMSAGAGGVEFLIRNTDGVDAQVLLYDAVGGLVATLSLSFTETLGRRLFYILRIGAGGTASCRLTVYDDSAVTIGNVAITPSGTVALNQDQRWGRSHTGSAYNAGTCFRWAEVNGVLADVDTAALISGTYPTDQDLYGVDGNVVDDADPVKLWGYCDNTGLYASTITFEATGSPTIVVGS